MKQMTKKAAGIAGSLMLLTGAGATATAAFADQGAAPDASPVAASVPVSNAGHGHAAIHHVDGTFSFTQVAVTDNAKIAKAIKSASAHLCGAAALSESAPDANAWHLTVGGDVAHSFTAALDEFPTDDVVTTIMGCSCSGNPADGAASVNAEVTGVLVKAIAEEAGLEEGANTIVFTSADGMEVALPLAYVMQRCSIVVFDVNGAPLADSVGGTNQLWLGSTSARYFARDVTGITFEKRQTPPPAPGSAQANESYANMPNIAISEGA